MHNAAFFFDTYALFEVIRGNPNYKAYNLLRNEKRKKSGSLKLLIFLSSLPSFSSLPL